MEKAQGELRALESTLEKYRMNMTKVSREDLNGKYRVAFQGLKAQLKVQTESYLKEYCLSGLRALQGDSGELVAAIRRSIQEGGIGKRAGRAVFRDFDVQELQALAQDLRNRIQELYGEYFDRHTCLYAAGPSWDPENPQPPLIYNDLVDKFWDDGFGEWVSREKPPGDAILIFIQPKEGGAA